MSSEDDRIKEQERRSRQMARGATAMPADLVQGSQQVPTATATNVGSGTGSGGAPGRQSRSGGSGGAGMSERNRKRMEEEQRIKAQARQGRSTATPVRMPSDLVPSGESGQQQQPGGGSGVVQPTTTTQPPPQSVSSTSSRPMTASERRMQEEKELKDRIRRSRTSQAAQRMPNDLQGGSTTTTPDSAAGPYHPQPRVSTTETTASLRGSARGTSTFVQNIPRDLHNDPDVSAPSGEFTLPNSSTSSNSRPTTTTTVVASHNSVKDRERNARDLVHGTVSMARSAQVLPSDLRSNNNNVATTSGEFTTTTPSAPTTTTAAAATGSTARFVSNEDIKQRERQSRQMARASASETGSGARQQKQPVLDPAAATGKAFTSSPPQRNISDHEHAKNRISEEEMIKQRERAVRVAVAASGDSFVDAPALDPSLPSDLVVGTMEPPTAPAPVVVSTGGASAASLSSTSTGMSSRRSAGRNTSDADAKAKERGRRQRTVGGSGVVQEQQPTSASSDGPAVVEEEAGQIPVGAVSVFTNGVVVQQQRGELTQLEAPPIASYQPHLDDDEEAPVGGNNDANEDVYDDEEQQAAAGTSVGAADADAEQALRAYTPGSGGSGNGAVAAASMVNIDEEKEIPWYKSSEFRFCFCCVLVAAIAGAIAAALLAGKEDGGDSGGGGGGGGGDGEAGVVPTPPTIDFKTESPTASPTDTPLDEFRVDTMRNEIVDGGITPAEVLDDPETPQHEAYLWIIRDDEFGWTEFGTDSLAERYIMATFFFSLGGSTWLSSDDWLDPFISHCNWEFVGCGNDQFVATINTGGRPGLAQMAENNLAGPLPLEIAHLSSLTQLRVQGNRIDNMDAIGQGMPLLSILDLGGNSPLTATDLSILTGQNLPSLGTLSLRGCGIEGAIPTELLSISSILSLSLSDNSFTGTLTTELGSFPELRDFVFENNRIEGDIETIIDSIHDQASVRALIGDANKLTGSLPPSIGNFTQPGGLISFRSNALSGNLPTELGLLSNLRYLYLSSNFNIEGQLPSEMGQMVQIEQLHLDSTFLTGTIPSEFSNLANLDLLNLAGTLIEGTTDELCAIPDLEIRPGFDLECTCPGCTVAS